MVRFKLEHEKKAKDWDFIFKAGLVLTLIFSAALLVLNFFIKLTDYPLLLFFALPVAWSIIGMVLAHKYSSAETRDMHKVSDYVVLSLCGYFGAFFLTVYALDGNSVVNYVLAIVFYLVFYYSSWKSLRGFMEQKNIPLEWGLAWFIGVAFFIIAVLSGGLMQNWSWFLGILILMLGIIFLLWKYWGRLVRQFGYAERYRKFIYAGLAFNYFSLILWTLIFMLAAGRF
jgi:hypothetical protein